MELILFILFGLAALASSLVVILARSPVTSVLMLVASFFSLAMLYVLLGAPFVAALQVIVYAGAIMVLFLFVVMLLNLKEKQIWEATGLLRKWLGFAAAAGVLLVAIAAVRSALTTPVPDLVPGSPVVVGKALYTNFLVPFEVASVLLLIAIIGVVAMLKKNGTSPLTGKGGSDQ
ncbi:MAG: NADH-quinone oxidoreductase subunit J [Calditrichaeota bacterium]|nr:NADH-quinone oxidoreductase subunit J [Calditrichota bacterium]